MPHITPNLWFDPEGERGRRVLRVGLPELEDHRRHPLRRGRARPAGTVLTVDFVLDGQEYTAINGGPSSRSTRRSRC